MSVDKKIVAISYHSLKDPLCEGLLLQYLIQWLKNNQGRIKVYLLTFENKSLKPDEAQISCLKNELEAQGIIWIPQNYRTGKRFVVVYKMIDFLKGYLKLSEIKRRNEISFFIGFTTLSAILTVIYSKILRIRNVVLNFEPHSQYLSDFKEISPKSLSFFLLSRLEKVVIQNADTIALPTKQGYKKVRHLIQNKSIHYLPTSIDTDFFKFSRKGRDKIRAILSIQEKKVLLYMGKFGGIYYSADQFANIFNQMSEKLTDVHLLVITPHNHKEIEKVFKNVIKSPNWTVHEKIEYSALPSYISAADFGLLLIPPHASQRYRCPVKTGNYLSVGLPIIINHGIADDYVLARKYNVGFVVGNPLQIEKEESIRLNQFLYPKTKKWKKGQGM